MRNTILLLSLLALDLAALSASAVTFAVDPRGSYLRAGSEAPPPALAIDLVALGLSAGRTVLLTQLGSYRYVATSTTTRNVMTAVFSSSSTLLGTSVLNRVPGAIDAGTDFVTPAAYANGQSTDIAQDFQVFGGAGTRIVVPTGARYLFVAAVDDYYSDNASAGYAVGIQSVPGPLAALPFALMALRRRKRA